MLAATVYNNLVSTLQNNPALKEYITYVFKGARYEIGVDDYPCIMVEITGNNEIERDFGQIKKIWLEARILAYAKAPADPNYAIVGQKDMGYYGVLDIENDIRGCLSSSYSLGDIVEDVQIQPTLFKPFEMDGILYRGVEIPVKILYRQNDGA